MKICDRDYRTRKDKTAVTCHANLNNASSAYAAVMGSHRFEGFASLAESTMLVHSKNSNDHF